ncbi:hypothetical protein ACX27_01835 [Nostoc piscinale CENA21]|uniref:Uncharacterized protein n=1 Tax=Nostoc piscinale CENA21 TaxID=224013 RepID=A0A0M4SZI1_9NOSO|nr:hypothetical protein [Nostoc piscinale]ALF51870.1 hypothetical protein ACX27_01835 [Nostoc piscinale CENA21]
MINNFASGVQVFDTCTSGEKTLIANSASLVIEANVNRRYAVFINTSVVEITLSFTEANKAAINKGIVLKPGGSYEINSTNLYVGAVSAISKFAAKFSFVECVE